MNGTLEHLVDTVSEEICEEALERKMDEDEEKELEMLCNSYESCAEGVKENDT